MKNLSPYKNILCVRLDNMGDVLMSSPAMRALKDTFDCRLTLLTSSMGEPITPYLFAVDEVIVYNVPWVKHSTTSTESITEIVRTLADHSFDAAIIFTVFSQSSLPAAMLTYLAGIPVRLAYCRENPYDLLTHWIPDEEPYAFVRHQVRRDLDLVKTIGAHVQDERLSLRIPAASWTSVESKLINSGIKLEKPWLVVHPGVSEKKREYPRYLWIETVKKIISELHYQVVLTGSRNEKHFIDAMQETIGTEACSLAGLLDIGEFITLIEHAPAVVSVNTATIHIAAATHTPVVVLYALTNPQHAPWKVPGKVLLFDVPAAEQSKNEVIRFVRQRYFNTSVPMIQPEEIVYHLNGLLHANKTADIIPEIITL